MTNELPIYRGDTPTFNLAVIDSAGAALPLTGYTIKFTAKKYDTDTDADAIIGPISGTITDAAAGTAYIKLTTTDTDVAIGTYDYDIQIYNSSTGAIHTIVKNNIIITNDVTKEL